MNQFVKPFRSFFVKVGIVSYGSAGICGRGRPGVFVRITKYMEWIQDNLEP